MRTVLFTVFNLVCIILQGQFPSIDQGNIEPGDRRLASWIDESERGQITIASFNVRNLGDRRRSFKDYLKLVDYVNEADIVVFQEVGLGIFDQNQVPDNELNKYQAIIEQLRIAFGTGWDICLPVEPSGVGNGREANIIAYRTDCNGFSCLVTWDQYVDLGPRRDMPVYNVQFRSNSASQTIRIGSVHLKPDDPHRGEEMIRLADWIAANNSEVVIVGDFNWGYRRTANIENYRGENRIMSMHESGEVFQLFHDLSYLGKARNNHLRTNMGFRKSGYFYDQILLTPDLAGDLANGGDFLNDCGIFAFDLQGGFFRSTANYLESERSKGLNKYIDLLDRQNEEIHETILEQTRSKTAYGAKDYATYYVSDHRIVWVQLDVF
jgi:endonuclease/exonuclease/phosphatase family metal-dependent hydrolase